MESGFSANIEHWPLDRLIPHARNARTHSEEQVAQIAGSIAEFGFVNPVLVGDDAKNARQTYSLSETQVQALDQKLDYLIDAAGRLGRKDWLNTFIGVALGYILVAALPPESARAIFQTFLRAIGLLYPELPIE